VKPNTSGDGHSSSHGHPDNIDIKNTPLRMIIMSAYRVKDYQIAGPAWLQSERYDIVAKAPLGTGSGDKIASMLQTLLEDRFKLETHRETKDFPVYGLVPAKGGLKIKQTEPGGSGMDSHNDEAGGKLTAEKVTMARLAEWLSRWVDRPVIDMTGTTAAYDFTLKYSIENQKTESTTVSYPILTLAIQDQLGVRLEKRVAPIEMLVIDHAEKVPAEN